MFKIFETWKNSKIWGCGEFRWSREIRVAEGGTTYLKLVGEHSKNQKITGSTKIIIKSTRIEFWEVCRRLMYKIFKTWKTPKNRECGHWDKYFNNRGQYWEIWEHEWSFAHSSTLTSDQKSKDYGAHKNKHKVHKDSFFRSLSKVNVQDRQNLENSKNLTLWRLREIYSSSKEICSTEGAT